MKKEKQQTIRDYSHYIFNKHVFNKSRLVLEVLKKYIENNPNKSIKEIQQAFPKEIIKSKFEIVVNKAKAKPGRFFLHKNDIIKINKSKIAVTNQWTINNINKFIKHVEAIMNITIIREKKIL